MDIVLPVRFSRCVEVCPTSVNGPFRVLSFGETESIRNTERR